MLYEKIPGESYADRALRIMRDMNGCSLLNNKEKLQAFIARGVEPNPAEVVLRSTNCAEVELALLAAVAGSVDDARAIHPRLAMPCPDQMSFAWLTTILTDLEAWVPTTYPPPRASILWYKISGTNDDHAEFMMDAPDEHGGGGRANNAITVGNGDVHFSWGRPIHGVADLSKIKWNLPGPLATPGGSADETLDPANPPAV